MTSIETAKWLRTFYGRPGGSEEAIGDDLGTTFGLCGAVILASLLTASRSPERLAALTGLPVAFTAVVIANMDYLNLWRSDRFSELCRAIRGDLDDHDDIEDALNCFLEEFWDCSKLPGMEVILPALRGTSLLFGRPQSWIHQEFFD